jgi:hypothetical protein
MCSNVGKLTLYNFLTIVIKLTAHEDAVTGSNQTEEIISNVC